MMVTANDLLRSLSSDAGPAERHMVADALDDAGRPEEAELLRRDCPGVIRHYEARYWVQESKRPLREFRGTRHQESDAPLWSKPLVHHRVPGGKWRTLSPRASLRLHNKSPDGFEWGYRGSGPAQLALALLLSVAGRKLADARYQKFKQQFVSRWPKEGWTIFEQDIWLWLDDQPNAAIMHGATTEEGNTLD